MNDFKDFTPDEMVILIDFYERHQKWELIKRIIKIEHRDTLREIVEEYK